MKREKLAAVFFAAATMLGFAASAGAVDGTIEINQAKVVAAGGFPYTISASGSYRLTSNLTLPTVTAAIIATAANVTLDLNGFSIIGAGSLSSLPIGINSSGTVENGTVTGFGTGIKVGSASIVRNVHADANGVGIEVENNSVVEGCTANNSTQSAFGISCTGACMISGNTSNGSSGIGIYCQGGGCVISSNTASANSVSGIECDGSGGCKISSNTVNANGNGVFCGGPGSLITNNTIDNNTGKAITAFDVTTAYGWNVLNGDAGGISGGTSMAGKNTNSCGGTAC